MKKYYKIYYGIMMLGIVEAEDTHEAKQRAYARYRNKINDFEYRFLTAVELK